MTAQVPSEFIFLCTPLQQGTPVMPEVLIAKSARAAADSFGAFWGEASFMVQSLAAFEAARRTVAGPDRLARADMIEPVADTALLSAFVVQRTPRHDASDAAEEAPLLVFATSAHAAMDMALAGRSESVATAHGLDDLDAIIALLQSARDPGAVVTIVSDVAGSDEAPESGHSISPRI